MQFLDIPAVSGAFFNDILVMLSLVGCSLMFLSVLGGSRRRRLEEIGAWGTAPLVFGIFFQVSQLVVGFTPEQIGFLLPMSPGLVNGLFAFSLFLFGGWWWLRRNPQQGLVKVLLRGMMS
jgi:hypothetical protein